jgi:endoglucanase
MSADDFIFSAWGKTTWGSAADKASLEADIAAVRGNFTDIPLVIGEWDASSTNTEPAARWKYFDFFLRTAAKYNTSTMIWDNGNDHFDRATNKWRDPTALSILMAATKGEFNALPDSSTGNENPQQSSAYAYHKLGTPVSSIELPYLFNGNKLLSITDAQSNTTLLPSRDYILSPTSITLTPSFLTPYFSPNKTNTTGPLTTLHLTFSAGAPTTLTLLSYTTPTLLSRTSALPATSSDLYIPIKWAGLPYPAAVRALKSDGGILIDDWTQWLGPLQQGRMTYSSQWDWDSSHVILKASVLDAVRAAGKDTTFSIEFFPREEGNSANYTITV